jgi:glutamyl-tRNA reductase
MKEADIVVSSTGCPQTILHRADIERVMAARQNRPLFLIDIAVPRDIDPDVQELDNVYLYNIDDLEAIVRENVAHRAQDLALCESILEHRAAALLSKLSNNREASRHVHIQPQPAWLPDGAAALGS